MPRGLAKLITCIRALAAQGKVWFTLTAYRGLSSLDLDVTDACETLEHLKASDFNRKIASVSTGEWMYVFKPFVAHARLYVKLILRNDCVVISFHDDDGVEDEE